jgi:hypothetical protein
MNFIFEPREGKGDGAGGVDRRRALRVRMVFLYVSEVKSMRIKGKSAKNIRVHW